MSELAKRLRERARRLSHAFNPKDLPWLLGTAATRIEDLESALETAIDHIEGIDDRVCDRKADELRKVLNPEGS